MANDLGTSFPPCPECGLIHPPEPGGCPIVAAQKNQNKPQQNITPSKPQINIPDGSPDFSDMIEKIIEISNNQIKMKNLKDDEIPKLKQFVIIELTKAFERFPRS